MTISSSRGFPVEATNEASVRRRDVVVVRGREEGGRGMSGEEKVAAAMGGARRCQDCVWAVIGVVERRNCGRCQRGNREVEKRPLQLTATALKSFLN